MNEDICKAPSGEQAAQYNQATLAPQRIRPEARDVNIKKVANGFIVNIGCQTFVTKTWLEASTGLAEYWTDPVAAEKKFCAA